MQEESRKSQSEIKEQGNFLIYEKNLLRLTFSAEKKNLRSGVLQVMNVTDPKVYHMDQLNLALSSRRKSFVKSAIEKLGGSSSELEELLDEFLLKLGEEKKEKKNGSVVLNEQQKEWAISFLKNKNMFEELKEDFGVLGCVGEELNLITCYLVATSRFLEKPLAAIITSQSGAGKSTIMDAALSLFPEDEQLILTRITPSALYYMAEGRLKHAIVGIGEEQGVVGASHALRSLISDGKLSQAVTLRDPRTGQLVAQERVIEGPCAVLSTTTIPRMDEETWMRVLRLSANETEEQTKRILQYQLEQDSVEGYRREIAGKKVRQKHYAVQKLLKKIRVENPYIKEMTFRTDLIRVRREHEKYLKLIRTIAILRQYQKEKKKMQVDPDFPSVDFIEVTLDDIDRANKIAEEILVRTLDELTPPARNLLIEICNMVKLHCAKSGLRQEEHRFTRKNIRYYTKWSDFQIRNYIGELETLEYLKAHRGGSGMSYVYELVFDGDPEENEYVPGLVSVERLREKYYSRLQNNGGTLMGRLVSLVGA